MIPRDTIGRLIAHAKGIAVAMGHVPVAPIFLGAKSRLPHRATNIQIPCRRCGRRVIIKIDGGALRIRCDLQFLDRPTPQNVRTGRPHDPAAWERRIKDAEQRAATHRKNGRLKLAARVERKIEKLKEGVLKWHSV